MDELERELDLVAELHGLALPRGDGVAELDTERDALGEALAQGLGEEEGAPVEDCRAVGEERRVDVGLAVAMARAEWEGERREECDDRKDLRALLVLECDGVGRLVKDGEALSDKDALAEALA